MIRVETKVISTNSYKLYQHTHRPLQIIAFFFIQVSMQVVGLQLMALHWTATLTWNGLSTLYHVELLAKVWPLWHRKPRETLNFRMLYNHSWTLSKLHLIVKSKTGQVMADCFNCNGACSISALEFTNPRKMLFSYEMGRKAHGTPPEMDCVKEVLNLWWEWAQISQRSCVICGPNGTNSRVSPKKNLLSLLQLEALSWFTTIK